MHSLTRATILFVLGTLTISSVKEWYESNSVIKLYEANIKYQTVYLSKIIFVIFKHD